MALTFDPCKPLKTRGGGRGSKLTLCGTGRTPDNCNMSDFAKDWLAPIVTAVVTLSLREGSPLLWKAYKNRYREPKEAHRQVLLDQASWYEDRAAKLATFRVRLLYDEAPDRFKLAEYVATLDPKDREWAMKETDVKRLREWAAAKEAECHDNAAECSREADNVSMRTLF